MIAAGSDDEREIRAQSEPDPAVQRRSLFFSVGIGRRHRRSDHGIPRFVEVGRRLAALDADQHVGALPGAHPLPPGRHEIARYRLIVGQPFRLAIGRDG